MKKTFDRRQLLTSFAALAASSTLYSSSAHANAAAAFYRTGEYTYCDLKILSKYWGKDTYGAKILAGTKILSGNNHTLKQVLTAARPYARQNGVSCNFNDADNPRYTYNDAVRLAHHWGVNTPWDAKVKITGSIFDGQNLWVRGEIASLR